jgi:ubiquinone/menaquinone biosynthesis C-methylase UbiE
MTTDHDPKRVAPMAQPMAANENVNATFFDAWKNYQDLVGSIDTYDLISRTLVGELRGRVVDVGSGGVVNYNCGDITDLVLIDISTDYLSHVVLPPCAAPKIGTAVDLPLADGAHDCLLMQMLVHHLAEGDYATTRARTLTALREAYRVLKPGGKIVVVESVVNRFFETAERLLFRLTRLAMRLIGHPMVFQWTPASLCAFARETGFIDVRATNIPRGRWMIFLGRRWPTMLVPVSMCKIVATKPA